jgi:hypothetical protein
MSYLGYRGDDADTPFGDFYRPEMAQLPGRSQGDGCRVWMSAPEAKTSNARTNVITLTVSGADP